MYVYCSVSVCTGVLVRFGWSRVVSECRLEHGRAVRTESHIYIYVAQIRFVLKVLMCRVVTCYKRVLRYVSYTYDL